MNMFSICHPNLANLHNLTYRNTYVFSKRYKTFLLGVAAWFIFIGGLGQISLAFNFFNQHNNNAN
jgi:hypothetical protein